MRKPVQQVQAGQLTQTDQTKKSIKTINPGTRYGYLTAIEPTKDRRNSYTVWRCRCDCGNEYMASSRELKKKKTPSCKDPGCEYYREVLKNSHHAEDLTGRRYGKLVVLGPVLSDTTALSMNPISQSTIGQNSMEQRTAKHVPQGRKLWICKCDCGNTVVAASTELKTGNRKSCGCLSHPPLKDWIGHKFGMLTVTSYAGKKNGVHFWKCRCECGNETTVNQSSLQSGHTTSCGCQAKPVYEYKTLVDGTCVELLRTALKKGTIAKNNTSGVRGVYWDKKRQNWVAQITFKGKTLYLGSFANIGEATTARKRAEERYFGEFLEEYDSKVAGAGATGSGH